MKLPFLPPLLAFAIAPVLSQTPNAESDSTLAASQTSGGDAAVPSACTMANSLIKSELAEISRLQSANFPVPDDLAGYFYSVVYSRKLLGCPSTPLLSSHSNLQITDDHPEVRGEPCKVLHVLYQQVVDPIHVLKLNDIPIPAYLAGLWSSVSEANQGLKCGYSISTTLGGNSTGSQGGSE